MKLTPVTLPPGRLRLATRPTSTGSPPVTKTIGTVVVAALAASAAGVLADDQGYLPAEKVRQPASWQPVSLISPSGTRSRRFGLREACFLQAPSKCFQPRGKALRRPELRKPITGIADCCARAASGHAAARAAEQRHKLAPSYVEHGGFLAQSVRRTLSLPQNGGRVAAVHCPIRAHGRSGSKCEELALSICRPVYPR